MDKYLIDYLKSGEAWVLIGSGPSNAMGYPSWEKLAEHAVRIAKIDLLGFDFTTIDKDFEQKDYPEVFEKIWNILGAPRLLQCLREILKPSNFSNIYKIMVKWPVPVFLTTNYDDEIQKHLAELGESYIPYLNSEDHFACLSNDLRGAIFKLHGDLRSERGLVLTKKQYDEIENGEDWLYWRTKMTSIFQMKHVVVIGHSLTDKNIKYVLKIAKNGAGVHNPICWIAPDIHTEKRKEYLEKYRIRVISYDNKSGDSHNLVRLIECISDFIPQRTSVYIQSQIKDITKPSLGANAAAPAYFVYNRISNLRNYDDMRVDIVVAAIQSVIPELTSLQESTLEKALQIAGWPLSLTLDQKFADMVTDRAIKKNIFIKSGEYLKISDQAESISINDKKSFNHLRNLFIQSLGLRLKRNYQSLNDQEIDTIAADIESSLIGYFKEGGLSLSTILFAKESITQKRTLPSSIIKFINDASTRYDSLLKRQAFITVSIDAFVRSEPAEREYLGKISQGFFAFNALGVFGDLAKGRIKTAKETVWLIDSSAQIPALALSAPTNVVYRDCFRRLNENGIRLFTTDKLFTETYEHLWFAKTIVEDHGEISHNVIAAAMGQTPFYKSNQFLEGFVRWQASGNPSNWKDYMFQIFGDHKPSQDDMKKTLLNIGIETISMKDWPGFISDNWSEYEDYIKKIMGISQEKLPKIFVGDSCQVNDIHKKVQPEAEALMVVEKERQGKYYILSKEKSPSCFISQTSILNIVADTENITWQPESFVRFASTLPSSTDKKDGDKEFEALLINLAQTRLNLLDERIVENVFGGIIDQSTINIDEQRKIYDETLSKKYGESIDDVIKKVPLVFRPIAEIQLLNELAQNESQKRKEATEKAIVAERRAKKAEEDASKLKKYKKKIDARKKRDIQSKRKHASKKKTKKRKKK